MIDILPNTTIATEQANQLERTQDDQQLDTRSLVQEHVMTATEARLLLRINKNALTRLLRTGTLTARVNPLDRRQKLILRREVEALARAAGRLP